jgi:hypothetical protein
MEQVASYEAGVITIYIGAGTHYLLRNQDIYFPTNEDINMMDIELKIQ